MKIVFAADGSKCTKKALAFLVTHEGLLGERGELFVLNVQAKLPPHVRRVLGSAAITEYASDEAEKVLVPVRRFLDRHPVRYRTACPGGGYARRRNRQGGEARRSPPDRDGRARAGPDRSGADGQRCTAGDHRLRHPGSARQVTLY